MPRLPRNFPRFGPFGTALVMTSVSLGIVRDFAYSAALHLRSAVVRPERRPFLPGEPGYPTLVPIGGIWERWDFLDDLMRFLNRIGFGVHVIPSLRRNREGLDVLSARIIDEIRARDLGDVVLVGHSKGGLIGKAALLRAKPADRVRGLVAIAAPYQGSGLANLVIRDEEVTAFRPSSRQTIVLERLDGVDDRIVNLASTFDQVLGRSNSLRKAMNVHIDRIGHFMMLGRRESHMRIAYELERLLGLPAQFEPAEESPLAGLRGRVLDLVRDYGFAVGWQLRSLVPDRARLERWRTGDLGRAPIVLLPGVIERWPFLTAIGDRLHRRGHAVHVVPALGSNIRDSTEQALLVAAELERLGLERAVLVAHSKGGLIGKRVLLAPEAGRRVTGLVAIATPFSGSRYARVLAPPLHEFSPTSRGIRSLLALDAADSRIVSIWPQFDQHIPGGSAVPGAMRNVLLPLTGHFQILSSSLVLDEVERAVADFEAAASAAAEALAAAEGGADAPAAGSGSAGRSSADA